VDRRAAAGLLGYEAGLIQAETLHEHDTANKPPQVIEVLLGEYFSDSVNSRRRNSLAGAVA
jgi:hypothetical protein